MKLPALKTIAALSTTFLLVGCSETGTNTATNSGAVSASASAVSAPSVDAGDLAPEVVLAENADNTTVNLDEWDESDARDLDLDETVTITEAGVYRLTGDLDGGVVVAAPEDALVVLILDGVNITSSKGAAIEVQSADDVAIHLATGSTNTVSDAATYPADATANAAIYSEEDLTISGTGALTVTANSNDGITSKDDLVILDGTITVTAVDDALRGKDSLVVEGGTLDLNAAAGDGLKSDGDQDDTEIEWTRGYIHISGGSVTVNAGDDGLQAFTDTVITGGTVEVAVVDDAVKADVIVAIGAAADVRVTASTEGIEAANIGISAGTVDVTASDDGINASGNSELQALSDGVEYVEDPREEFSDTGERLEISGGTVTVDAEGDGLDSNGSLTISGGDVTVYGPVGGGDGSLDADGEMSITGGTVTSFGPGSMEQTPGTDGQGWVLLSGAITAGESLTLIDAAGADIADFTSRKQASTVIYSSADISTGETYTLNSGGVELGSAVAGEGSGFAGPGGGPGAGMGGPGGSGGGQGGFPEGFPEDMPEGFPDMMGEAPVATGEPGTNI